MKLELSPGRSFFKEGLNLNKNQIFTLFVLFWIGLGWLGLLLALFGIFYTAILAVYLFFGMAAFFYFFFFNKTKIRFSRNFFFILSATLFVIFIFSYFTAPSIFSGRDQGSLSEAAIRLSQNHQLEFSFPAEKEFFKIYGPGKALNFPGFNYTADGNLITQFSLGYVSWLAIFYSIFGLFGFVIANSISFFIFLFSFYLLARNYLRPSSAMVAFFLVITSFIFSWFFKFTLSENLALGLLWFGIYEFVLFIQRQSKEADSQGEKDFGRLHLLASFLSLGLLSFSRIEGVAFFAVIVLILLTKYRDRKHLLNAVIGKKMLLVLGAIVLVHILNIIIDGQAYLNIIKGLVGTFISHQNVISEQTGFFSALIYNARVFWAYGLFVLVLFGIAGFFFLYKRKQFKALIPFFIVLPNFIYLFNPNISADHPWMLRRFVFGIVPVCILYAIWFLDCFIKKRFLFYIFSGLLLVSNLIIFIPYLTVTPNKNLLQQVKVISDNFTGSDLVLVDQLATGDGWSMMAGPMNFLYGKQAVYFFNPEDLGKINVSKFSHVYLVVPDESLDNYAKDGLISRLTPVHKYQISNLAADNVPMSKLEAYSSPVVLPSIAEILVNGKIYLYQ